MIPDRVTISAPDDFPGITVEVRRPKVAEWSDYQDTMRSGNGDEAALNILIACGRIVVAEGTRVPANMGELCDEWPNLPDEAFGQIALMAGTFAEAMPGVIVLDLPAILAAAERAASPSLSMKPSADDIKLAEIAVTCGRYGLDADTMRTIIACNPRRNSYRALMIENIDAVLVYRRPRFPVWSQFNRARRNAPQAASTELSCSCVEHPSPMALRSMIDRLPSVASSGSAVCVELFGNVRVEVGKGQPLSAQPAATPSSPPAA